MNLRRHGLGLVLFALPLALRAADPPLAEPPKPAKQSAPNPMAPRFKQVRDRIESLFQNRNDAPPPLEPRFNPFRTPGSVPPPPVATVTTPPPANSDGTPAAPVPPPPSSTNLAILQQAVATLKVSGVFEIGGKSHLVINARPYKEGDVVQTLVQGETIYLRVREISKRSVTLVLNDAEMTLRF